jgi:predicted RNA-binding protein with RPS1 domain
MHGQFTVGLGRTTTTTMTPGPSPLVVGATHRRNRTLATERRRPLQPLGSSVDDQVYQEDVSADAPELSDSPGQTSETSSSITSLRGFVQRTAKGGVIVEVDQDCGVSGLTHAFLPWQEAPISINKRVKRHETMKELMPLGLWREFVVSQGEEVELNGYGEGASTTMTPLEGASGTPLIVSAKGMDSTLMWKRIEQIFNNCTYEKESFSVMVNGVNKGGLTAYIAGYPVFVPISQLIRRTDGEMWDAQSLQDAYMKKRIRIAMLEMNRDDRRVVCSELRAVENDALRGLAVGKVIQGRVRKIEKFGVFVGIQGTKMSALLHVSNISGRHVDHPEDVLQNGETVTAMIIGMDEDYSNISLSTAVLEEERGAMMEDKKAVYDGAEEMAAKVMQGGDDDA